MCDQLDKPGFHRPDLWHNMQLGIAKAFAANALVTLMDDFFPASSVDAQLQVMTTDFLKYCKDP